MRRGTWLAAVAVTALVTACSDIDEAGQYRELGEQVADSNRVWEVVGASPDDIAEVSVTDGTSIVVIRRDTGRWVPGEGADELRAALMADFDEVLTPMLAFRQLDVDVTSPEFGLDDSELRVTVRSNADEEWALRLGGPTPSGYGYYVTRNGDPHVYTVIPQVVDGANSLLTGEKIVRPVDSRLIDAVEELSNPTQLEEEANPWLAQVLAFDEVTDESSE